MDSTPLVSVIVPAYKMGPQLSRLLACLEAQSYPAERFECLLVDNHPQPTLQLQACHSFCLKLLHEPRPGSYAARNRGVSEAAGELLAFTDADCLPRPTWLEEAVSAWLDSCGDAVLGGRVALKADGRAALNGWCWHSLANDLHQERYIRSHGFAATANLVVSRGIFERLGGFDGSLYSSGDADFCSRARQIGADLLYVHSAVVEHPPSTSMRETVLRMRRVAGGRYVLCCRGKRPLYNALKQAGWLAVRSFRRTLRDPFYPSSCIRLQVIAIDLFLKLVMVGELLRLGCGGLPVRG